MSERFSNLSPENQALMADRYGMVRRNTWKIPAAIFMILFLPWLMWSAWHHSNPEFRITLVSFQNDKSDSIDITYLIERRDPSQALICTVVARDIDKNVVGEIEDSIPPSTSKQVTHTTTIPARITPVNAAVLDCRASQG
ncbi:MAG: DUF4307 domain-containing protein [Actinomycetota bacterium]